MILRIFILTCAVITLSFGDMKEEVFLETFKHCFQEHDDEPNPSSTDTQDIPLANTLEYFISLAEKLEEANPLIDLKDELAYFISGYMYENIKFVNDGFNKWKVERANIRKINELWESDLESHSDKLKVPFTEAEKCSLYLMISHSMFDKDFKKLQSYSRDYNDYNISSNLNRAAEYLTQPQELGAVAIRGTEAAISLSRVLVGLYVGMFPNRERDELHIPEDKMPNTKVDLLYATTLAGILMQSKWKGSDRPGLAPNGVWESTPNTISGFCPMVYKHNEEDVKKAYSYSSVRGAADGLILGLTIRSVYEKKSTSKLSQILRMYYSPDGLPQGTPGDNAEKRVSFCNRTNLVSNLKSDLYDQMEAYGYAILKFEADMPVSYNDAKSQYDIHAREIYEASYPEEYCRRPTSLDKPENLPRETFLDIIVVMDSSVNEQSFQDQQLIAGYLAKELDLRYTGSQMTILLDRKMNGGSGTSSKIELVSAVKDTHSSSCAGCIVGQLLQNSEQSPLEREDVIIALNQFLQERKENETQYSGVNGKVVIYFNFENGDGVNRNNKIQGRLEKALRDFHLHNQDVLFYAVGLNTELLKKFAKNDPALVFLGSTDAAESVAKDIFKKISFAPALLQYSDCEEAKNERAAIHENFISPYKMQHYVMPAEYFYKSKNILFTFESQNGYIKVCHNRATMKPENEDKFCRNTTKGNSAEFKLSNPCKGLTKDTCSPFYFSIMGMDTSVEMKPDNRPRDYCNDINGHWCSNLDQIKYKIYHDGIRCSGCLGLGASQAIMLFTVIMTYFVYKQF